LPDASSKINALRDPQSSTNIQYIDKKNEEVKEHQSRTYWWAASRDHDSVTHQHAHAGSQQKEKGNISETQSSTTFHKEKVFTKSTSPMIGSRAKYK
jgi:hypothetical protein